MKLRISKEHGVNPSVEICTICGKGMGVVLFGTSYKDANGKISEAPHEVCTGNICEDCKRVIDNGGIFFIEVRDGESGNNPYRTGRVVAVKEDVVKKILKDYNKINYVEQSVWKLLFPDVTYKS